MSYDLMVYNPDAAPKKRKDFLSWYEKQAEWSEDHDYDDPEVLAENLKPFFFELIKSFPPMNGPYASDDVDDPKVTDYSIGNNVIYGAFAWSQEKDAYDTMIKLAEKHHLGFFALSNEGAKVWELNNHGEYKCIHHD